MSVNGIKLAVGQQWQTRYGNKVTLQENPGMDTYVFRAVNTDNEWCSITKDGKSWETDSGSFLQRLISSPGPVQFNPRPGDKIICNNGEEFTCCTLEYLQETISNAIQSDKSIFGYDDSGWQDWDDSAFFS